MNEIWKDIESYEDYQVSTCGRVKSLKFGKEKFLKLKKHRGGYIQVNLWKDGNRKQYSVQRLVAIAFIANPENKPHVNHKDENKENNCVWNLEWCDAKYNNNYGTNNKKVSKTLTNNEKISKKVICVETNKVYPSTMEAYRQTGVYNSNIVNCCNGKLKTAGKFHWRYVD